MTVHIHLIDKEKHKKFLTEERKDPFTQERIKASDRIVFCAGKCQCAFLLASWEAMERKHCNQTQTLKAFPQIRAEPLHFKKSALFSKPPSYKKSDNRPTLFSTRNILASFLVLIVIVGLIITMLKVLPFPTENKGMVPENVSHNKDHEIYIEVNRVNNTDDNIGTKGNVQPKNFHFGKSDAWRDSFYQYSSIQKIKAPFGFVVKSDHYLQAKTLKEISTSTVIGAIGYLETDDGRFYMSSWSWDRALKGEPPNWIFIK